MYLSEQDYIEQATDSKLFDKLGTFCIDTIASKKLNREFFGDYSALLSLDILTDMVEYHSYSLTDKLSTIAPDGISDTGLERINTYNSLGWLTRLTQYHDSRIKFCTWNLLKSLVSQKLISQHPTLVDESLD